MDFCCTNTAIWLQRSGSFNRPSRSGEFRRIVTLAGDAASHRAVDELREEGGRPPELTVRTSRSVNTMIEQDRCRVKQRERTRLGGKRFGYAAITISGIELVPQIKKKQFDVSAVCSSQTRTPQVWEAVLAT